MLSEDFEHVSMLTGLRHIHDQLANFLHALHVRQQSALGRQFLVCSVLGSLQGDKLNEISWTPSASTNCNEPHISKMLL